MNQPRAVPSPSLKKPILKKSHPKETSYTFFKNSMDQPRADIIKKIYTQIVVISYIPQKKFCILILQKILILFTTILTLLFFFFFRKISISLTSILALFFFSFFRKILVPFVCFFFNLFFVFFYNSYLSFLYIKRNLKNVLSVFLYALEN